MEWVLVRVASLKVRQADVLILTNGPGEVMGWAKPSVEALVELVEQQQQEQQQEQQREQLQLRISVCYRQFPSPPWV